MEGTAPGIGEGGPGVQGWAGLVGALSPDVFASVVRRLLDEGDPQSALALCASSQDARRICRDLYIDWGRARPDLASAYGAVAMPPTVGTVVNAYDEGEPYIGRSLLATALAQRRGASAGRGRALGAQERARFCVMYALYILAEWRRAAFRQWEGFTHGAAHGLARHAIQNETRGMLGSAPAGRYTRAERPGPVRRMVRAVGRAVGRSEGEQPLPPPRPPGLADVLLPPGDVDLRELEARARYATGVIGYPEEAMESWGIEPLDDDPLDALDRRPVFFVDSINAPVELANTNSRRFYGQSPEQRRETVLADLALVARDPRYARFRQSVRDAVNEQLSDAFAKPRESLEKPTPWDRTYGANRAPARDPNDPAVRTVQDIDALGAACGRSIDVYAAYVPTYTYLSVRPYATTPDLINYDIFVALPL
jgi:hypothetical protein